MQRGLIWSSLALEGLHGLRRLLLGSVSRKVLAYTTKSVLIVPGGSTQAGLG